MKRIAVFALIMLLPVFSVEDVGEAQDGIDELLDSIDVSDWDDLFREYGVESDVLPSEYLRALAQMQMPWEDDPLRTVWKRLVPSVKGAALRITLLLGIAAIGAALNTLSDGTEIGESAQTAFRVVVAGAVLILAFSEIRSASNLFSAADRATEILLPALIAFLSLSGMEHSAILLTASQALFSGMAVKTIVTLIVPLSSIGGVMLVLDTGGSGRLSSVGRLFQRASKWILGTVCSLYLIVTAVRSAAAASADGLLIRTTKLAAGSIPSIGALMSDSVDTAFQCLRFVRSALGLTGCIVMLAVCLKPILSMLLMRCSLRASAMLAEPLSGKPYAELLRGMGDTLHILLLSELATAAMALLVITPVFGAGGAG